MQVNEVWAKVGHMAKAQNMLGAELEAALEDPRAFDVGGEGDKDEDTKKKAANTLHDTCTIHDDMSGLFLTAHACMCKCSASACGKTGIPRVVLNPLSWESSSG